MVWWKYRRRSSSRKEVENTGQGRTRQAGRRIFAWRERDGGEDEEMKRRR